MALHTVPDPPGEDTLGLADQSELDAVAALISTGSTAEPPPTEPRFVMIDRSRADTQVPARTVAGWYPDESDPGLRRYWDGHHLTGQTVRVDAEGTEPLDPEGMAVGGKPVAGPLPRMVSTTRDQAAESSWTTLRVAGGLPAVPEEPAVDQPAEPAGSDADTTGAAGSDTGATGATGSDADADAEATGATGEAAQDTPDLWADKVVDAVARARAAGTPEEWRQVASVAVVVSELAGTMVVATSAARAAEEAGRMAERTRQDADAAAEQAAAARAAEQEATERARRAQEAATAAAEAAAQAAEEATRAEREAPEVAAVADTAAREAASAQATLEGITTIVAEAEAADTPDAWSEAHRLAEAALAS